MTRINIDLNKAIAYAYAGRFSPPPSGIEGLSGVHAVVFDLEDLNNPPRAVFDTPEDNTENVPNALYRSDWSTPLENAVAFAVEESEPLMRGLLFSPDEPLLTTLSNRAIYAGGAPEKVRQLVEQELIGKRYWRSEDTVPAPFTGQPDIIVLRSDADYADLLDDKLTELQPTINGKAMFGFQENNLSFVWAIDGFPEEPDDTSNDSDDTDDSDSGSEEPSVEPNDPDDSTSSEDSDTDTEDSDNSSDDADQA